jgi:hypothetical protein
LHRQLAGTSNSIGISITMSGSPKVQPGVYFGNGGRSLSSPFGAPASTQATMASISFCESLRSLLNLSVEVCGSANQGGISRSMTVSRMALLHGRTSAYEVSGIGATSPGRWQLAHLLKMIDATSLVKVTPAASFLFMIKAAAASKATNRIADKRFISSSVVCAELHARRIIAVAVAAATISPS